MVYQSFFDESLNKTFKKVLRLCHQCRFEAMALLKLNEAWLTSRAVRQQLY